MRSREVRRWKTDKMEVREERESKGGVERE
jgi:hypothetical protein